MGAWGPLVRKRLLHFVVTIGGLATAGWFGAGWLNRPSIAVFNWTDSDVSVDIEGQTITVESRHVREVDHVKRGAHVVARHGDVVVDEASLEADQRAHFIFNVAGAGDVYLVDYSGLYECTAEGHEGRLGVAPIVILEKLQGRSLMKFEGRDLLLDDEPLPETAEICDLAIVRAEVVPPSLVVGGDVLGYLTSKVLARERFRVRLHAPPSTTKAMVQE